MINMNTVEKNTNIDHLMFRLSALESDHIIYKRMIKDYQKQIHNLTIRLKKANKEIKQLKQSKVIQMTIFDYKDML